MGDEDHPHDEAQLPSGVKALKIHPRKRMGSYHFGLGNKYSETIFFITEIFKYILWAP
jgi:hypothetical protein